MHAQLSVTTWRNDISRTGQNLNETILNTSDVNSSQFGKLFSQAVDGYVYAQPLYLQNVTIGGVSHNVVFVATEHDSVYAFDADSNGGANANPLWFASMLTSAHGAAAGATTVSSNDVGTDIIPEVGITGTPVIDPSSGTLYVVSATAEGTGFVQRLHALDVTSGAEKFGGPMVITASVAGTGNGSSGGTLTFDNEWQNQRPGLLLLNGIVYIAFSSHGDAGPWHGWVMGYNAQTLKQTGVFCTTPNGNGGGTWMGGSGLAAEVVDPVNHPYGRMFVATGNGDYTATTPYAAGMDYGDSVLNLDLTNGVPTVQDEFTPMGQAELDQYDGDQGSGGILILPTQTTGSYPHLLVQAGKSGEVYLLNREGLGGYYTSADHVVQELPNAVGDVGTWSTPAYWNGNIYYWAQKDTLKEFSLVNGLLSGPNAVSSESYGFPGANPAISANGTTQGIVWSIDSEGYMTSGSAILQAHDAGNPSTTLYSSSTNSSRDNPGLAVKFTVPTVVNGKVYVGAQYQFSVFGLLSGQNPAADPVFTPGAETFNSSLAVSMTDATPGATIYYTLDGSTPTVSSAVYTSAITIKATTTINAMAIATGYLQSPVTSATYVDSTQALPPTFNPNGGTFTQPVSVTINDATTGAAIYYTTDGTTPTTSSTKYTGAITVGTSETVQAIGVATGVTNSAVSAANFTISSGTIYINYANDGFTATNLSLNNGATVTGGLLQLTDGGTGEDRSAWFLTPVPVGSFITDFTFQLLNPTADGMTFTIQGSSIWALGDGGGGLGYQGIPSSVAVKFDLYDDAGEGTDSTGLYLNGAAPTVPSADLTSTGINLHSGDIMNAQLVYDGSELTLNLTDTVTNATATEVFAVNIPNVVGGSTAYVGFTGGTGGFSATQNILSWNYVSQAGSTSTVATPAFSPGAGTYTSSQSVTISDSTSGATIYYTTNGTTPTTSSAVYSTPITVSATETLQALAVETGYTNSAVGSAAYTIAPVLPTPTFSPAGGTYTTSQSVTISDSTSGTTIYYTTNGTTPTTSSTKYAGAITVKATETLKAIAVETGYTNSAVGTAAYTITAVLPTPTFLPAAGTYTTSQSVTISDSTSGTTIYYTTNGTTPTTSSTKYTGAIAVSATETLKAIAVETGYTNSAVGTAAYTIAAVLPTPTFLPAGGTYTTSQSVTISDSTSGTTIYYTTNGTTPTTSSTKYTGAITVSATETLEAIAVETGYTNSAVATAAYTISSSTKTTPTVSVTSSLNPSNYGSSVTFTAVVSGSGGTPTGTVTFLDGTTTLSTGTLSSGSAKFATASLGGGSHSITASYGGDTNFNAAKSSALAQTVNKATPTVTLTSNLNPSTYGSSVTFTAVLAGPGAPPSAAVTFLDGTTTLGTVTPSNGTAAYSTTALKGGSHSITAAFAGDTNYNAATSGVLTEAVNKATPTLKVTNSPVTYNGAAQSAAVTGSVAGTVSNVLYGGSATVPSTPATYAITANFTPTDTTDYNTLTGASGGNFVINKATPTIALTSSLNPSALGASVTFTVTLAGSGIAPGGAVTFLDGTTTLATVTSSGGVATYATTALTAGTHSITASFAGSTYFNPTTSSVLTQTVNAGSSTTYINYPSGGFTATNLSLNYGASVTGGLLQLTDGGTGEERSAWFATPVPVGTFTTDFTFQQLNATADGMTFTIQGSSVWALGSGGGGLGYQGIPSSVAVKFDLYNNAGEGTDSTGLYTGGAAPTVPSIDLSSTGINLHSGDTMHAHMVYDGTNLTMTLTDTVTNATVTEVFAVNIPSMVGGTTAYIGFTGGTGGFSATQNVLSWTYSAP
jgi:hypothetical protein